MHRSNGTSKSRSYAKDNGLAKVRPSRPRSTDRRRQGAATLSGAIKPLATLCRAHRPSMPPTQPQITTAAPAPSCQLLHHPPPRASRRCSCSGSSPSSTGEYVQTAHAVHGFGSMSNCLRAGALQFRPVDPRLLSPRRLHALWWPQRPHSALQRLCNGRNGRNGRVIGSASSRAIPYASVRAVRALVERIMGCRIAVL